MPDKMSQGEDRPPARLRRRGRRRADRRRARLAASPTTASPTASPRRSPAPSSPTSTSTRPTRQAHYASTGPELWEQTGGAHHAPRRRRRHRRHDHRHRALPQGAQPGPSQIIGADPVGSIYSGGEERQAVPRRGRRRGLLARDVRPRRSSTAGSRSPTRDAFLTTRRLAPSRGHPRRRLGRHGASHAALEVAREIDDPEALVVVILPDGGRSLPVEGLQRRVDDAVRLPRARRRPDGRRRPARASTTAARSRRSSPSRTHEQVRDAVALLHEHRVSQLPVVSAHDPHAVVGSVGERGLLAHAVERPGAARAPRSSTSWSRRSRRSPPTDPVREAVELLAGERQALLVTDRRPRRPGIVTRADLLEALAR